MKTKDDVTGALNWNLEEALRFPSKKSTKNQF